MKKLNIVIVMLITSFVFMACEKVDNSVKKSSIDRNGYTYNEVKKIVEQVRSNSGQNDKHVPTPGFFDKVWKWIKSKVGTSQRYDDYGNPICPTEDPFPCGPCGGICIFEFGGPKTMNASLNNGRDQVTDNEYQEGYRAMTVHIIENNESEEEKVMFEFKTENLADFTTSGGSLIIQDAFYIPKEICDSLHTDSIKILEGEYPVIKDDEGVGATVVESEIY